MSTKGKREEDEVEGDGWRKRERGGVEEGDGKLARYTKAEVGVVFPVNTELQHVRGERFSDGYAEEHAA